MLLFASKYRNNIFIKVVTQKCYKVKDTFSNDKNTHIYDYYKHECVYLYFTKDDNLYDIKFGCYYRRTRISNKYISYLPFMNGLLMSHVFEDLHILYNFTVNQEQYKDLAKYYDRVKNEKDIDSELYTLICNNGNINCANCKDCYGCVNCLNCKNCYLSSNLTQCTKCIKCTNCAFCKICKNAQDLSNNEHVDNCICCRKTIFIKDIVVGHDSICKRCKRVYGI